MPWAISGKVRTVGDNPFESSIQATIGRASPHRTVPQWMAAWVVPLLFAGGAWGADITVSAPPPGQDALPRIEAALEKARPGDRVVLRAGEYRLSKQLTFPRGGQADQAITLAAAPGEYAALMGSVRLTEWQRHENNIWKVKLPARKIRTQGGGRTLSEPGGHHRASQSDGGAALGRVLQGRRSGICAV